MSERKHAAIVCENDTIAEHLKSHLNEAGVRVTRYAKAPQCGQLQADVIIVDATAIRQRTTAALFLNVCRGPVIVLGEEADLSFPLKAIPRMKDVVFAETPYLIVPLMRHASAAAEAKTSEAALAAGFAGQTW